MLSEEIRERLFELRDAEYRDFQCKLIPTVDRDYFIGVRTPALRALASELSKRGDTGGFLAELPHKSFDENQLHAFIISLIKDYDACLAAVNEFLPYVDNWATCDQMSPKVFKKHRDRLIDSVEGWMSDGKTYTVRFGTGMLMQHYLDGDFKPEYLELAAKIRSDEYYVNMMTAWLFATALAKQYGAALPYIEQRRLDAWTHNKAIQKAVESRRITVEQKKYLKTLKTGKGSGSQGKGNTA